jgi:hypothetical protein
MAIRVSIVIPTRNRPAMAVLAIRAALNAAGNDDEVIVADNGDLPLSVERGDARLRVLRDERVYSMPENWERGVRAARGQDLVLLSDRHRLVPGSLDHLLAARSDERDVVTYSYATLSQQLPSTAVDSFDVIAEAPGTLAYSRGARERRERLSRDVLDDWYATMRYRFERPMLTSALVPRRIVADVVRSHGRFFEGMAPDVSSSLHILAATERYVETNVMAILGQFPSTDPRWSNGLSLARGQHAGSFLKEFAGAPLGQFPPSISAVIYQTLAEFSRLHPVSAAPHVLDISRFARAAAIELESAARVDRAAMHWALFRATQAAGPSPRALFQQLRTVVSGRLLGFGRLARRLRALLGPRDSAPVWSTAGSLAHNQTLAEGMTLVERANGPVIW